MPDATNYEAIVIGSGQGGKPLAVEFAKAGRHTALIERSYIGGTCINYGCTPTKTMYNSARVAYLARRAAEYGVHCSAPYVNMSEVRARKQSVVDSFRNGSLQSVLKTENLDFIEGDASFSGPHSLSIVMKDGSLRTVTGENIFINTGGRPVVPDINGLSEISFLDSTSIMELDQLPDHLIVLGGGYIGLEFGQMFRRYGSDVTIVQRGEQLLNREDPDVAEEVVKILREDGITVLLNADVAGVSRVEGQIRVEVRAKQGVVNVSGSHLLVATGRAPNTEGLKLEAAQVKVDKHGFIVVSNRLETSASGIYALGDVKGGPQFTHISYDDYRIIKTNMIDGGDVTTDDRPVPYAVFIDPQLGRVGLTETEARANGFNLRIAKIPMTNVARAIEMSETRGFIKAIVDSDTDQILGCAVLGVEGGELMSMIEIAMMGRLPYTVLKEAIFAHPTLAESLNNLFLAMDA